jgi:transcriptional regulator GlxA family with amidase domain
LQDGRFYTCGSGTAPIEMALVLVAEDYGEEIALAVARELVVDFRPVSGVEYRTRSIAVPPRTEYRLASLPDWIATRLQQDLSVEVLAERARLCPRHFSRIFKQAFKVTPAEFVEWLRINEAARRLLAQDCAIEIVATAVGFKSSDAFRKAFIRVMGLTPSAFQRQHRRKTNGKVSSPRLRASA